MYVYGIKEARAKAKIIELQPANIPKAVHFYHQKTSIGLSIIYSNSTQDSELLEEFLAMVAG